ncbi:Sphingosine kinase 2 [Taenia crassiceps]|uniref:Sphingosine kinase 2 n=1 Tax=Taenia crassiceps TaxID=6207 RepID=A0ABR4QEP0_9CEST
MVEFKSGVIETANGASVANQSPIANRCDVNPGILIRINRDDYAKPIFYTVNDLLCVNIRMLVSHTSVGEFVPCWLASKHSSTASPGRIAVRDMGLYLSNRRTCSQESLLLPWSCILRWQNQRIDCKLGIFRVYVAGLVHPCVPNDLEALVAAHQEHSFQVDGFSRDASLDICCLNIVVDNIDHNNLLSAAFQKFAWCCRKERAQKSLLLVVNKFSGQGKAKEIVSEFAGPLLTFSGLTFEVMETGYRGHASDYVKTLPLNDLLKYGAIVYVGGDGLLFEIVNGLYSRGDLKAIPLIGCIPAGSGNAVPSTLCYRSGLSTLREFLRTCCILLALPRSPDGVAYRPPKTSFLLWPYMQMHRPMIVEADVWSEPKMCSVSITWGIVSEVDLRSEFIRLLGSIRFVLMFMYLLMRLKKYRCTLSFLPSECDESVWRKLEETFGQDLHLGSFSGKNTKKKGIPDESKNPEASYNTTKQKRILPSLNESIPDDWVSITSNFIGINVIHISHLATDGVYFADKTLGSDHIILHLMPSNMSRSELIRLMRTSYNGHSSECSKTGIALSVKAFRISIDEATSQLPFMWSADGEPVEGIATLQAEVYHRGYPLIALPPVSRNTLNHAPDFE